MRGPSKVVLESKGDVGSSSRGAAHYRKKVMAHDSVPHKAHDRKARTVCQNEKVRYRHPMLWRHALEDAGRAARGAVRAR